MPASASQLTTSPRTVTAIVVGYNHAHCLGRCFDSLAGQRDLDELQIIYVDNASDDSSVAATSWHTQIQVIKNATNVGFASAVNMGLAAAQGNYVALVNPDTAIDPYTLAVLVTTLQRRPELGLVGPRLLNEEGRDQQSLADYPTLPGLLRRVTGRPAPAPWIIGAFLVAETALLRRIGGLDETYFVYGEDMELSHRVQQAGLQVWLERSTQITHTGNPRWTTDRLVRIYGAYLRFLARHHQRQRLPVGLLASLLWVARGAMAGGGGEELLNGLRRIWSVARDRPPAPPPGARR
jgi:N-acetylglucosaminyl-diphospho-decaprenol L-rhamnosyltransferase